MSSQTLATPGWHCPPTQVSSCVQTLPSLQLEVFGANTQPCFGSQLSSLHGLPSWQGSVAPGTQTPPLQVSVVVHRLPSLQASPLAAKMQPVLLLQLSVVQGFPSSHTVASPGKHWPPLHASPTVHALLSLQSTPTAALVVQPLVASQLSVVQGFLSSHWTATPTQSPSEHLSPVVQVEASSHAPVLGGCWHWPLTQLS